MPPYPLWTDLNPEALQASYQSIVEQVERHKTAERLKVLAVSKYIDTQGMQTAYQAGIRHFGENRIQDALDKLSALPPEMVADCEWHFIGHLQSNKITKLQRRFTCIHSIDSLELLRKVSDYFAAFEPAEPQSVLLQVNIAREASKHGFDPDVLRVAEWHPENYSGVRIDGLMTMLPVNADEAEQIGYFKAMSDLREHLAIHWRYSLPEMSMGMSQDYIHAAANGATIIRVGKILFEQALG